MSDLRTRRTLFAIDRTFFNLLKTHAFTELNVSLICTETHITRSTFYQYYLDLDDWLERIVGRYTLEAQGLISCADQASAADVSALVTKLQENRDAVLMLFKIHHPAGDLQADLVQLFATAFAPLVQDDTYLAQLYAQAATLSVIWQLQHPKDSRTQPLISVVQALCDQA